MLGLCFILEITILTVLKPIQTLHPLEWTSPVFIIFIIIFFLLFKPIKLNVFIILVKIMKI